MNQKFILLVIIIMALSSCTHDFGEFAPVPIEQEAFGSKPGLESMKAGALRTVWVGEAFQNSFETIAIPFFWIDSDATRTAGVALTKPFRIVYHGVVGPLELVYGLVSWPIIAVVSGTDEANAMTPQEIERYDHNWLLRFEKDNPNATLEEKMEEAKKGHFIYEYEDKK